MRKFLATLLIIGSAAIATGAPAQAASLQPAPAFHTTIDVLDVQYRSHDRRPGWEHRPYYRQRYEPPRRYHRPPPPRYYGRQHYRHHPPPPPPRHHYRYR